MYLVKVLVYLCVYQLHYSIYKRFNLFSPHILSFLSALSASFTSVSFFSFFLVNFCSFSPH